MMDDLAFRLAGALKYELLRTNVWATDIAYADDRVTITLPLDAAAELATVLQRTSIPQPPEDFVLPSVTTQGP
jgi:hypothetical protein